MALNNSTAQHCLHTRTQFLRPTNSVNSLSSSRAHNFLSDQIASMCPPLLLNEAKPNFTHSHINRTTSSPSSFQTTNLQSTNSANQQQATRPIEATSSVPANPNGAKRSILLFDYVLYESQSINDTFGTAFNTKNKQQFYWKRFDRCNYMKKMEAYFIMEGSERIFGFKELIHEDQFVYAIFEHFYGDLHSYMKEKKRLDEPEAKSIFRQCVQAVNDCHQNGIIVRDIKLKKFVFVDAEKTKIKLTNPEDCLVLDADATDDFIKSQQGCPAYVSPEVLNTQQQKYSGKLSDSWSLGIVLFTLLLGRYPFHHQTITTMFVKIARGKFQIPPSTGLSLDAKILLRSLIRLNPNERLLSSEILSSNWLKQNETDFVKLQQNKFKNSLHSLTSSSNILISNHIFSHKPLGISHSSPIRLGSTAVNEPQMLDEAASTERMVPVSSSDTNL